MNKTQTKQFVNDHQYRFYNMADKPLKHAVYCNSKMVIPAGALGVKIAFRQSHLYRLDENNNRVKMNVYLYNGHIYHV